MSIKTGAIKEMRERTGLGMMDCKRALEETNGDIDLAIEHLRKKSALSAAKKSSRVAAEGRVAISVSDDKKQASLVEINSETDFVARDENFVSLADSVVKEILEKNISFIDSLGEGIEKRVRELTQKVGEKIDIRRLVNWSSENKIFSYVHTNSKIGVLVDISNADDDSVGLDIALQIAASAPQVLNSSDISQETVEKEKSIILAQAQEAGKTGIALEKIVEGRLKKFISEIALHNQAFVKEPSISVETYCKQKNITINKFVRYEVGEGIDKRVVDFATEVYEATKGL